MPRGTHRHVDPQQFVTRTPPRQDHSACRACGQDYERLEEILVAVRWQGETLWSPHKARPDPRVPARGCDGRERNLRRAVELPLETKLPIPEVFGSDTVQAPARDAPRGNYHCAIEPFEMNLWPDRVFAPLRRFDR